MYGIVSIIFVSVVAFVYYEISISVEMPYTRRQIKLQKRLVSEKMEVFAECVDKQELDGEAFRDIRVKSNDKLSLAVSFDSNTLLRCQQLVYAVQYSNQQNSQNSPIHISQLITLKALLGKTEITFLPQYLSTSIPNNQQFILLLTINYHQYSSSVVVNVNSSSVNWDKQSIQSRLSSSSQVKVMLIQLGNNQYIENIRSSVFWLSWFNLIGIALVTYYRGNLVFNNNNTNYDNTNSFNHTNNTHILPALTVLVYLIWMTSTHLQSFYHLQIHLQLVTIGFIVLLCIKMKLNLFEILLILSLTVINQWVMSLNVDYKVKLGIFAANLVNLPTIYLGQNKEVAHFSLFSFLIIYGLNNPLISIVDPFPLSFILVNLIFGPTLYELLQLRQYLTLSDKKAQQRLHSHDVSQAIHLFRTS